MSKNKLKVIAITSAFSMMSLSSLAHASFAQNAIAPDATLPNNTLVNFNSTNRTYTITGGTQVGTNQFHSFQDFSVPTGNTAHFDTAPTTVNAIGRVTGSNISDIDGLIKTNGATNLYLVNPNGITFGANARLDIAGSFSASTANSIKFSDGSEFSATNPQAPPLLNVNVPLGLQYGNSNAGATINNRGNLSAGQDLVLNANKLDLQGTLQSGRDLTLQAQDAVKIRDTLISPFVAAAGRNLLVQGNHSIDIFALSNPNSIFSSGANMLFRSNSSSIGDAHFYSGGNLRFEKLNGTLGNLLSPYDPVILASGDVSLGDYSGASLHILAGGSVTLGNVNITRNETPSVRISVELKPGMPPVVHFSVFSDRAINPLDYPNLAKVNLTDYQVAKNSDGSVRNIESVPRIINIDGNLQPTLDVRAGVDWSQLGGLPISPTVAGIVNSRLVYINPPTRADINVNGNIAVSQPRGLVLLTNQFKPNSLPGNISINKGIDTSTNLSAANGGDILIYGRGDIAIAGSNNANVILNSSARRDSDVGNSGLISIVSNLGNISLVNSSLLANSQLFGNDNYSGNGGSISLASNAGNVTLNNSSLSSESRLVRYFISPDGFPVISGAGTSKDGGMINLLANSGNLILTNSKLNSSSIVNNGKSGNGGKIALASKSGNIMLYNSPLDSRSHVNDLGSTQNSGAIHFASDSGNITVNDSIFDSSNFSFSGSSGNGGAISLASGSGDVTLKNVSLKSNVINLGDGGAISVTSNSGNITLNNSTLNSSSSGVINRAGKGGEILLRSNSSNITLDNSKLYSFSYQDFNRFDSSNAGNILILSPNGNIANSIKNSLIAFSIGAISKRGGDVIIEAKNQVSNLEIFTQSSSGQAGNVQIKGKENLLLHNLQISTSKTVSIPNPKYHPIFNSNPFIDINIGASGKPGDITITGLGNLTFDQTVINSATQGIDSAGNISITSPSDIAFQNSQILSNTLGIGNAGIISIQADRSIIIKDNSEIAAKTSGLMSDAGKAGDIILKAPIALITGGSQVLAETTGNGAGGNIIVNAPTSVNLMRIENAFPVLSVQTSNAGKAGNILIDTPVLTLSDQARITATATANSTNKDGGGSITLNASKMNLFGTVGVFAETQGIAPAGTLFLNPYSNETILNLVLAPNSQISASTSGFGNGGSIFVAAPEAIAITGQGKLAVETSGIGNAGNIRFTTGNLTLSDGVLVSASTSGAGKAGDISIQVNNLTLSNGASIQTTTSSTGDSGKIEVIAGNSLILDGNDTGLFAKTAENSTGNGGSIIIDPPLVSITNGAGISVDSLGKGNGGDLTIFAGKFVFANDSFLRANTANGEGGNINLQIADIFFPRNNISINATAGGNGNGGNINLSAMFTISLPSENNDIFANASFGTGGNINLTTQGLLGFEFRPRLTPLSDITASSDFGLQGNVNINTPDVDPSKGLTNLPVDISDASKLVAQKCLADRQDRAFVITGRGGIPASPADVISGNKLQENLGMPTNQLANQSSQLISQSPNKQISSDRIVEAQGWTINPYGEVSLVAEVPQATLAPTWARQLQCR